MEDSLLNSRILLVDDDLATLTLLQAMLAKHGYRNVVAIEDPRNVIDEYRRERTDLILLDLEMPHMDGFEVIRQLGLLHDPILPPVVVMTAQPQHDLRIEALNGGARDYITKPFNMDELRARVRNMLEIQQAHKAVYAQKEMLDGQVRETTSELLRTRLQIVQRLARAAEYRDNETGRHILRVSHTAVRMAEELGGDREYLRMMLHASPLHDVGKIGVPDAILLKPGALTANEWNVMRRHTTMGAEILDGDDSDLLILAREIALTHHERWDGSGYPQGLVGESIPVSGRIVSVVDVFDALTSKRPYKKAWSFDRAAQLVRDSAGTQFDPDIVNVFDRLLPEIVSINRRFSDNGHAGGSTEPSPVEEL
ncbi:MAG: HD-GYP domain-containing protein [Spirochaetales bacterium]